LGLRKGGLFPKGFTWVIITEVSNSLGSGEGIGGNFILKRVHQSFSRLIGLRKGAGIGGF